MSAEPIEGLSRPDTAKGALQRVALEYLREKQARGEVPTSIRFLFYELEQRGEQSKRRREPRLKADGALTQPRMPAQNLTDAVTRLREIGLVPWDWIVDDHARSTTTPAIPRWPRGCWAGST